MRCIFFCFGSCCLIQTEHQLRSEWISDLYSWCTANPGEMDYFDEIFHRKVEFPGLGGSWLMESNDLNVGEYRALVYDTWFKKNYDPVVVVSVRVVEELIERAKTLKENT